ncbi:hypothetical protein [Eudoraea sp.]|uniref:hypothetical protein n=1 Tax=Eudoraea sp. TaxID=1979955 RepID=UPI003C714614
MRKATLIVGIVSTTLLLAFNGTSLYSNDLEANDKNKMFTNAFDTYSNNPSSISNTDFCWLDDIVYIEENEQMVLGYDTSLYLPLGFNAYKGMSFDISEIDYVEIEGEIDLGFDTKDYLPLGFNPYAEAGLKLADIEYLEMNEDIDLGFDTKQYLPEDFNPYAVGELNLDEIIYIEEEEKAIELGFDPSMYLPQDFNALSL